MNKIYAGIGSRETPSGVCDAMCYLASCLAGDGWMLRSGRGQRKAESKPDTWSADLAFEHGARTSNGQCEIFLPDTPTDLWGSSEEPVDSVEQDGTFKGSVIGCKVIARLLHPNGKNLSPYALELHARNTYQILGKDLNTPVAFVACWTENGLAGGGTGQAIRLATMLNIPIYDYGLYTSQDDWYKLSQTIIAIYRGLL